MSSTILIIEDNKKLRENMEELLEVVGYKVLTARDGKDGLEQAKKHKPDLILCDIMMPVLDGYGVLRAMENIPEIFGTPFIFITSKAEKSDFRAGMDLGADDYLTKPFKGDYLIRVVGAQLKRSQLLRKSFENSLAGLNDFMNAAKMQGMHALSDNRAVKKIKAKDILFMESDSPNFLYFVVSGKLKTFKSNETGKELTIDIHNPGDFIGYNALLMETEHNESATAIEDSEIALIPKGEFLQLLYSNTEVAVSFVKLISRSFQEAEAKLLRIAYDSARKKIAEAIIFVCKKYKEEGKDELSFTLLREIISSVSGLTPESVSRNITDFKEEGLIETNDGRIKIVDLKKLESIKN